eukprot:sb/3466041/
MNPERLFILFKGQYTCLSRPPFRELRRVKTFNNICLARLCFGHPAPKYFLNKCKGRVCVFVCDCCVWRMTCPKVVDAALNTIIRRKHSVRQEPTDTSKQPIRTRHLGHVTGYQRIRDQYFLVRSVPLFKDEIFNVSRWPTTDFRLTNLEHKPGYYGRDYTNLGALQRLYRCATPKKESIALTEPPNQTLTDSPNPLCALKLRIVSNERHPDFNIKFKWLSGLAVIGAILVNQLLWKRDCYNFTANFGISDFLPARTFTSLLGNRLSTHEIHRAFRLCTSFTAPVDMTWITLFGTWLVGWYRRHLTLSLSHSGRRVTRGYFVTKPVWHWAVASTQSQLSGTHVPHRCRDIMTRNRPNTDP